MSMSISALINTQHELHYPALLIATFPQHPRILTHFLFASINRFILLRIAHSAIFAAVQENNTRVLETGLIPQKLIMDEAPILPFSTPVRRPTSSINTRQNAPDHEKDWTAARCNRLLRALTSRVVILKKTLALMPNSAEAANVKKTNTRKRKSANADDAEWSHVQKRIKKTYSGRTRRKDHNQPQAAGRNRPIEGNSFVPGEVSVPTPILARARGETTTRWHGQGTSGFETEHQSIADSGHRLLSSDSMRDLRHKMAPSLYTVYEGIHQGLDALLRATTEAEEPPARRLKRKSLMAMCLRVVPKYISQQQELMQEHYEETKSKSAIIERDISNEIYDELEDMGTSIHGWRHLRLVVRSHGVEVICEAIRAGVIDVDFCAILITLCLNSKAVEEAQAILSAMLLSSTYTPPKTINDTKHRPLSILSKFTDHTGNVSFHYRMLSLLVSQGLLPAEWLATKDFSLVWTGVMQALAPACINREAIVLLEVSLPLLAVEDRIEKAEEDPLESTGLTKAVGNTFSSLLTTLTSIVILSRDDSKTTHSATDYKHLISLLRTSLIDYESSAEFLTVEGGLLLFANLILQPSGNAATLEVEKLVGWLRQLRKETRSFAFFYNELVMFMCRITRCCGRGTSSSGFEYLVYLHKAMEKLPCGEDTQNALKGLIVDSAFSFAQMLPDRGHLDYAATMDSKLSQRGFISDEDFRSLEGDGGKESQPGFRWEEGIGEWVAATPALHYKSENFFESILSVDNSEIKTPDKNSNYVPVRIQVEVTPCKPFPTSVVQYESSPGYEASPRKGESLRGQQDGYSRNRERALSEAEGPISLDDGELAMQKNKFAFPDEEPASDLGFEIDHKALNTSHISVPIHKTWKQHQRGLTQIPTPSRKLFPGGRNESRLGDSSASTCATCASSGSGSDTGDEPKRSCRKSVDRAPRLGRRALRIIQPLQLFDESDDELSFNSTSSQDDYVSECMTKQSSRDIRRTRASTRRTKPLTKPASTYNDESEDELCI